MKASFIIIIAFLFSAISSFAQEKIFIWSEIDPGWRTRSIDYWTNAKGYGKSVPAEMSDLIVEYYSIAEKKLELSLKEKLINSDLNGTAIFTDNPGADILEDHDLFLDLQCMILEVSNEYPNFRASKLNIEPVIKYAFTLYDARGDVVGRSEILEKIDYKNNIRSQIRGMSEHRRDVEIVRHSFTESFSGPTIDQLISKVAEIIPLEKREVNSDPDRFKQVVGLLFDNRKLQYPGNYQNVRFEQQYSSNKTIARENITQPDAIANPEIANKLFALIEGSRYFALIIGVNEYADPLVNDLVEPLNDALRLYNILKTKYTFDDKNITFLTNPTRDQLIQSFDKLAREVTKNDNLLIFYAGHGLWDEQLKKGFWLPSNGSAKTRTNWFSNSDLKDYIGGIKAKHTLLISDACFSGGIFKTREIFTGVAPASLELYKLPSRKAMTSGAMTMVPDKSVFLEYLIQRLDENSNYFLSSEQLFASFKIAVINNSSTSQVPQYGEIRETGDEGGDFLFIRKNN